MLLLRKVSHKNWIVFLPQDLFFKTNGYFPMWKYLENYLVGKRFNWYLKKESFTSRLVYIYQEKILNFTFQIKSYKLVSFSLEGHLLSF